MRSNTRKRTFDEMLDALGHVQRRKLLRALLVHNPQGDESVAVAENETADEELTRLVAMQHVHLPKLEDYGFITWDQDNSTVSKGPNFEEIRPLLGLLADHEAELPEDWL